MKVAIVTALYYEDRFLPALFASLERLDYPREDVRVIMIDNRGSAVTRAWLEANVVPKAGSTLPPFELIRTEVNTGFAGGNNRCIRRALELGCDAVYLLNEDAHGEPGFLREAVRLMASDPRVGAVQSFIALDPPEHGVNSIGNRVHFLGFGYCDGYRMSRADAEGLLRVRALTRPRHEIGYASGAAVLFRASALAKTGLLDEEYFLYHEDLDLSWRIREAGFTVELAPESVVLHRYEFKRSADKFYWMERNRYRFLLEHFKLRTLAVLFPAILLSELGLFMWGLATGAARARLKAYAYILNPAHWGSIARKRSTVQAGRTVGDRALVAHLVPELDFQDVRHPVMRVITPLMRAYFSVAKRLIVW